MSTKIKNAIITLDPPIVDEENEYTITTIDLNQLITLDIASNEKIYGVVYNNTPMPVSNKDTDTIGVQYHAYIKDDQVFLRGNVTHNDDPLFNIEKPIDIDRFVEEIRQLITNHDIINIEKIGAIKTIIEEVKEEIHATAFSENILLSEEEFNYRIELYSAADKKMIGVANRLVMHNDSIFLYEAVLYDPKANIEKIDINIVLNDKNAIVIKNLAIFSNSGVSFKYLSYHVDNSFIMLTEHEGKMDHRKLNFKGINLPEKDYSTIYLSEDLINNNDQAALMRCYKANRKIDAIVVNVNRYLLG